MPADIESAAARDAPPTTAIVAIEPVTIHLVFLVISSSPYLQPAQRFRTRQFLFNDHYFSGKA